MHYGLRHAVGFAISFTSIRIVVRVSEAVDAAQHLIHPSPSAFLLLHLQLIHFILLPFSTSTLHNRKMAETGGQAPPGGDETRAPIIIGVLCGMTTLSLASGGVRLYTRFRLLRSPGWDDAVIVLSLVWIVFLVFESFIDLTASDTPNHIRGPGVLRYRFWVWKAYILSVPGRDLTRLKMELYRGSVGHC